MRKLLAVTAALFMVLPTVAFTSAPGNDTGFSPNGEKLHTTNGGVAAPTRFTDASGGFPGLGRRVNNCSQNTNGVIAHISPISADAWGGPFVIDNVTAGATTPDIPDVDMDVFFYEELADCEYPGASPITTGEFDGPGPGERGFIPAGTRFAVVYTPTGINTTFTLNVWAPPVIDLGGSDFDLTVASGATVVWENTTDRYLQVRSADFDSSPGPATGIRSGDTFEWSFSTFFGDVAYAYEVIDEATGLIVGTGTITVTAG